MRASAVRFTSDEGCKFSGRLTKYVEIDRPRMRVAVQAASLVDLAPPTIADVRVCARSVHGVKVDAQLQLP